MYKKEYIYNWREKHPEEYKEGQKKANKKYRENNKEKMNEISKSYYKRHREEILKKLKEKRNMEKESNNLL